MTPGDWPAVAEIYEAGIAGGNATFETQAPDWEHWCDSHIEELSLVARASSGEMLGWASCSRVSSRAAYAGVGEVSVYVRSQRAGEGIGGALLCGLIERSEQAGMWTLEASIFPENAASIALHQRNGFRLVGVRERLGKMSDGRWRDVLLYERRSARVGAA